MRMLLRILIEIFNNPGHVGIPGIFKEFALIKIFEDLAGSLQRYLHFFNLRIFMYKICKKSFKDVRAHCYCASLLRTQIHTPRHASSARAKK